MSDTTCNGCANWETWNASLWIGNDEMLYRLARRAYSWAHCVTLLHGMGIMTTGDGVAWDDPAIDEAEMDEMLEDL